MDAIRRIRYVLGAAGAVAALSTTPAFAQAYPGGTTEERKPSEVLGTTAERGAVADPAPLVAPVRGTTLAVTGGDIVGLTLLGGGFVAAGIVMVRRRRPATATA